MALTEYIKNSWAAGYPILPDKVNHMEDGIEAAFNNAKSAQSQANTNAGTIDHMSDDIQAINDKIGEGFNASHTVAQTINNLDGRITNEITSIAQANADGTRAWNQILGAGVQYNNATDTITKTLNDVLGETYATISAINTINQIIQNAYVTPYANDTIDVNGVAQTVSSLAQRIQHIYNTINTVDSKIGEIDSVYANGEKFTVCCTDCETWFRDMICQLCAHLDKEDFLEVCKIIKLNFGEGSSNVDCGESFSKLFSSICELFDCYDGYFGSFDNGIVDARNEWMRSCDIPGYGVPCRIPDKFCTGVVSIKFWKVMTIFFKTFLIDLANKSSDVANLSKEDFEQTYYSHCFDLAIDIFKLFEIDLEKETETEIHKCQELRQDINKNNFAEKIDGALEFLYEYRAPYRVKPPFNKLNETEKGKLLSCLGSFCTFIKSLVDSGQLEKLLK